MNVETHDSKMQDTTKAVLRGKFTVINTHLKKEDFNDKTYNKMGIEGVYLNIIEVIYGKQTDNIILEGKKS